MTLAPHDFANIKANVKVASTENGIIFGNIGKELFYSMWCLNIFIKEFLWWVAMWHFLRTGPESIHTFIYEAPAEILSVALCFGCTEVNQMESLSSRNCQAEGEDK